MSAKLHPTLVKPALAVMGLLLSCAPLVARADIAPNLNGSCPSGYTKGTNTSGKARCYSPRDMEHKAKQGQAKGKQADSKGSK